MYGKRILLSTIALIGCSGLAAAGEVAIGRTLASGVLIYSRMGLGCGVVICEAAGRGGDFSSLYNGNGNSTPNAPSLGLPTELSIQMLSLSAQDFANAQQSASSTPVTASADSFVMANGQITPIVDTTYTNPGDSTPVVPMPQFATPVISVSFNLNSTQIDTSKPTVITALATDLNTVDSLMANAPVDNLPAGSPEPSPSLGNANGSTPSTGDGSGLTVTANPVIPASSAPEPASDLMIGIGLVSAGMFARVVRRNVRGN